MKRIITQLERPSFAAKKLTQRMQHMPGFIVRLILHLVQLITQQTDYLQHELSLFHRNPVDKGFFPRGETGVKGEHCKNRATRYNRQQPRETYTV